MTRAARARSCVARAGSTILALGFAFAGSCDAASARAPFIADHAIENGLVPAIDAARLGPPVERCGWWDNPSPGNVWFTDRDGEWTVALQATYEAAGDGPDFAPDQQAPRGASHTHGCACLKVRADRASMFVVSIEGARPLALKTCRRDPALKGREPTPR